MVGNLSLFRIAVYETETRKKPAVRKIKRVTQRWENFETVLCSCRFNSALIPSFYPPFFSSLLSFFLSFLFFCRIILTRADQNRRPTIPTKRYFQNIETRKNAVCSRGWRNTGILPPLSILCPSCNDKSVYVFVHIYNIPPSH